VTITSTNFTGATAVSFNGVAATFTENPPGTITTTVPAGATTGPSPSPRLAAGLLKTTTRFTVTPAITSFAPANGQVGAGVTITGTNFNRGHAVSFGGRAAAFTVSKLRTVTTTVPFGAATGPITVTTLDGTAISATSLRLRPGAHLFGLTPTPSSQNVSAGASATYTFNVSRNPGFADNLTFQCYRIAGSDYGKFTARTRLLATLRR